MNKGLLLGGLVVVAGAVLFYLANQNTSIENLTKQAEKRETTGSAQPSDQNGAQQKDNLDPMDGEGEFEAEKSALELYKTADDALNAIKAGALEYDDRVLEQFTQMPEDCRFCAELYSKLKEMMLSPETAQDKKSYYAEILAVSGKVENIATLVEAIKNAPNQDTADAFSQALEMAVGGDDVTRFLGTQIKGASDDLRESIVAAVTNQGTRQAAEVLYNATVEKGDPDGYYSQGTGIGEFVPDESSMPYLHELVLKRDQYSHLAVKSLLNGGIDGLKLVISSLTNSPNSEFDTAMLKDAVEHVPFDDDTRDYLNSIKENEKDPVKLKFINDLLASAATPTETGEEEVAGDEAADEATQPE